MPGENINSATINTKPEIRRLAILGSIFLWLVYIILGLCYGKGLLQAISNGAAAAIGGLAGWAAYHMASRRNDGLIMLTLNMRPVLSETDRPFLSTAGVSLVAMIPICWIGGLAIRAWYSGSPGNTEVVEGESS